MVPLTNTRSPGLAPARRTMVPSGTLPNMAIAIVTGPGVRSVSPPNSGQANSTASPRSPCAKSASHPSSMSFGSASDSRKPSGRAPLAARSDKFTRSALLATVCAASSAKKCTPPIIASVLSTRSQPGGGVMKAASSERPSAPGCVASGLKKRAIRRSSADMPSSCAVNFAVMGLPGGLAELGRAQCPRQLVEHGIDHAGLVAFDKGGRDVGVFRHHHPRRHVAAIIELVGAGAQRGAQHRFDTLERPAFCQRFVDQRVELALLAHHTGDNVAEERRLGWKILRSLDFAAEPVALELGEDLVQAGAREIHLVERLHSGEPRRAALVRLARVLVAEWRAAGHQPPARLRLSATIASAARAAAPPLLRSSAPERARAWASVSTVTTPLPMASCRFTGISISAPSDSFGTISK